MSGLHHLQRLIGGLVPVPPAEPSLVGDVVPQTGRLFLLEDVDAGDAADVEVEADQYLDPARKTLPAGRYHPADLAAVLVLAWRDAPGTSDGIWPKVSLRLFSRIRGPSPTSTAASAAPKTIERHSTSQA